MADENYRRLSCGSCAVSFNYSGRSRPRKFCTGCKPAVIDPNKAPAQRACVGCGDLINIWGKTVRCKPCAAAHRIAYDRAKKQRIGTCSHPKPKFSTGRERKICYDCKPAPPPKERPKYSLKDPKQYSCLKPSCGALFLKEVAHQVYCSRECGLSDANEKALRAVQKVCTVCGVDFARDKTSKTQQCSYNCRRIARRGFLTCQGCQVQYVLKKNRGNGDGTKYCSRECNFKHKGLNRVCKSSRYFAGYCVECGAAHGARKQWSSCPACVESAKKKAQVEAANALRFAKAKLPVRCESCDAEFCRLPPEKASARVFCEPCFETRRKAQAKAQRKKRGSGRTEHRARRAGVKVRYFDALKILERDKWTCQLCGVKTPKALRGTYDPRAPEIDHIIPIAAGGDHVPENCHCACRACNGAKGAKPLGQLQLALA